MLLLVAAGCAAPWETVRREVADPVHELVHRAYPRALAAQDSEALAGICCRDSAQALLRDARALAEPFAQIEHASCVMETAELDGDTLTTQAVLTLEGKRPGGRRLVRERRGTLSCRRAGGEWRIERWSGARERDFAVEGPFFTEEAAARGLIFMARSRGVRDRFGVVRSYLPGSGLAVGDVDGDGVDDVVLVAGGELGLFLNTGGNFRETGAERGVAAPAEGECRFALLGDVENDGDADLFVGVLGAPSLFFRNDGRGFFTARPADEIGIASSGECVGACFADFDGDGALDLFIANGANLLRHDPGPVYNARNGVANQLLLNRGDGTFRDATRAAGVGDRGWALACTTADYDLDGDVDLFVANDFGIDMLYRNRGDATFEEVAVGSGIDHHGSSMGASLGDIDGDGDIDLFVAGMYSNSRWIIDLPGFPVPAAWPLRLLLPGRVLAVMREMMHGNRLYLNRGDGSFEERSAACGVRHAGWPWGGVLFDYDNDGDLDLYVQNGLLTGSDPDDL